MSSGNVLTVLLHGELDSGEGSYNSFDRWSTSLRGDAGSEGARLVTVHEALHVALNDTTAFGVLLAACAALAQAEGGQHDAALKRLVGQCRGVHEAFATFGSLWLAAAGDTSYLSGYPRYQRWYRDASDLVPLPDHWRRKEMMLEAAARVCMQAPVLSWFAGQSAQLADAWAPAAGQRPDERFALLHRVADARFWARAWDECGAAVSDTPLWAALAASDDDVSLRPGTYDEAFAQPLSTCAHVLYSAVAGLLAEHGAATLDYDGHRGYLTDVIAAVEKASPAARGLLLASSDERGVQEESFEMWRYERLVLRDRPRPAVVHRFEDLLQDRKMALLLSGENERMHVFGSVRPARRLDEQFAMSEASAALLRSYGPGPVTTVRSVPGDADNVELTVVGSPSDLSQLVKALPPPVVMHINISLSCLGDLAWRRRWSRSLRRARLTGLVDLSPMAQLSVWRADRQALSYAQATISDARGDPAELLVLVVGDTNLPLLLIGTAVTCDVLRQYIERTYPGARHDPDIIEGRQDDIEMAASHLVYEEFFFDLAAYSGAAAGHKGDLS